MTSPQPVQSLGEKYLALAEVLTTTFTRATSAEGLTFMEGRLLRLAAHVGEQSLIVDSLGVAPSRVSALLRSLERQGLVARSTARGDKRHRDVVLTPAGQGAAERIMGHLDALSPLMTRLDEPERIQLEGLLDAMLESDRSG